MSDFENRTFNGSNNNLNFRDWGAAGTQLRRGVLPAYGDGVSTLARRGQKNPNPRVISNTINDQIKDTPSANGLSDIVWAWGQYVDHEIDLTEGVQPPEEANITVAKGDPSLPKGGIVPFNRSIFDPSTGTGPTNQRQQINQISTYVDGSNVYGSDECRAHVLRTLEDGKLKTTKKPKGDLLPFNTMGLPNATFGNTPEDQFFVAGDIRANENSILLSMHTLFVREHNRLCVEIKKHPRKYGLKKVDDETIYQMARKVVGGLHQAITFNEFLPTLLGGKTSVAIAPYCGYNTMVEASIDNTFSTACYRVGHTMLSEILHLGPRGKSQKTIPLADAFFTPSQVARIGIDDFLVGAAGHCMQEIDVQVVDAVRNLLFAPPENGILHDLPSLNIQRGRDHGLPDYNTSRQGYGLPPVYTFSDITNNTCVAERLESVYGDVNSIDPWVGGLAEDHVPGANVGPFIGTVLKQQFERLRDGDRFWYENDSSLSAKVRKEISTTCLSDVIIRNTKITRLAPNVFNVKGSR